jgi:hypothetical protein
MGSGLGAPVAARFNRTQSTQFSDRWTAVAAVAAVTQGLQRFECACRAR